METITQHIPSIIFFCLATVIIVIYHTKYKKYLESRNYWIKIATFVAALLLLCANIAYGIKESLFDESPHLIATLAGVTILGISYRYFVVKVKRGWKKSSVKIYKAMNTVIGIAIIAAILLTDEFFGK